MKCLQCGEETKWFWWRLRPAMTLSTKPIPIPDEERIEMHWSHFDDDQTGAGYRGCSTMWPIGRIDEVPAEMHGHFPLFIPCDCPKDSA